ncbi:MAG: four helix bundle protein [Bacillota bacterium]
MTRDYDERDMGPDMDRPESQGADEMMSEAEAGEPEAMDRGGRERRVRTRIDSFEKMKVWQEAHALTLKVFGVTPKLPPDQQAGLALQMEQAAVGVPKGIAEGFKRRGPRNKAHFYNLAQTALESLRYYFILCRDLKYDIPYEDLANHTEQVSRMLDGLVRSMMRA